MNYGFISYICRGTDKKPEPPAPWVIRVIEPPGSTDEELHSSDDRIWRREGLTVFATEDEAFDDALRRLADAGYEHSADHLRLREEYREKRRKELEESQRSHTTR